MTELSSTVEISKINNKMNKNKNKKSKMFIWHTNIFWQSSGLRSNLHRPQLKKMFQIFYQYERQYEGPPKTPTVPLLNFFVTIFIDMPTSKVNFIVHTPTS